MLYTLRNDCVDTVEILKINTFLLDLGNFATVQFPSVVKLPIFLYLEIEVKYKFTRKVNQLS